MKAVNTKLHKASMLWVGVDSSLNSDRELPTACDSTCDAYTSNQTPVIGELIFLLSEYLLSA